MLKCFQDLRYSKDEIQTQTLKLFQDLKYSKDEIQTYPQMFSGFDIFCKDEIQTQTLKCFQDLKYFVRMKFKHICSNVFRI